MQSTLHRDSRSLARRPFSRSSSPSPRRRFGLRLRPASWLIFALLLCLGLPGCTLLAPYDPVMDQTISQLSVRTETALASSDAGQLSLAESRTFLLESIGTVRALKVRASIKAKDSDEEQILAQLEQRYLALLNRGKPLRTSVATGLRLTLLDLQQVQIAKKRSAASAARSGVTPP